MISDPTIIYPIFNWKKIGIFCVPYYTPLYQERHAVCYRTSFPYIPFKNTYCKTPSSLFSNVFKTMCFSIIIYELLSRVCVNQLFYLKQDCELSAYILRNNISHKNFIAFFTNMNILPKNDNAYFDISRIKIYTTIFFASYNGKQSKCGLSQPPACFITAEAMSKWPTWIFGRKITAHNFYGHQSDQVTFRAAHLIFASVSMGNMQNVVLASPLPVNITTKSLPPHGMILSCHFSLHNWQCFGNGNITSWELA